MWHDPVVRDRVQTALEEGIESQSAAKGKQKTKGQSITIREVWQLLVAFGTGITENLRKFVSKEILR